MNVRFYTTDPMKIGTFSLNDLVLKICVKIRPHRTGDQRETILCVPSYVQIDL